MDRIFILDDNEEFAEYLAAVCERAGHEAVVTTSSEAFVHKLEERHPDAIILDLAIPDRDGIEVMQSIADSGCKAPIIFASGMGDNMLKAASALARSKGLTVAGVLSKPVHRAHLEEALSKALSAAG